ncbi:molybdate transport system ATP-binding protein [Deinobacterium chartae]|uniref:Molybdate transport system ATP-binding protein n=1 Tax=Deinobacterium chartae TaxID=521158 RepID=A0A841I2G4_9DEIO|nr:ATP-binding cassette domain-containing protein [Deinobacterium chartae]MBB6099463.1 molybdate transport system ATP-binding protein [Deinobacterium chartae]
MTSESLPLVRLEGVHVRLGGRMVLEAIDFELRPGERWALSGPNGAGKSTLLRVVRGELWPESGLRVYHLEGHTTRSPLRARERFARVASDLGDSLLLRDWAPTAHGVVLSGLRDSALPSGSFTPEQEARAHALLDAVGLGPLAGRDFRTLSQGQRARTLLARALITDPDVLLLDEFLDAADAASRAAMRAFVSARPELTWIQISHRPEDLLPGTTRELRLEAGRVIGRGAVAPALPAPRIRPARMVPPEGETLIRIENVDVYRNDHRALEGVSWELRAGQNWALLGENGAGKSTLARLLRAELRPAVGGAVRYFGLPERATARQVQSRVGLVSAELAARHRRDMLGRDVIASGFHGTLGFAEALTDEQERYLHRLVQVFDLSDLLERNALELSQGQLARLLLARALAPRPRLLVLDEPFNHLDAASRERLRAAIEALDDLNANFVIVAHRPGDLPVTTTHALLLEAGRVRYAGPLEGLERWEELGLVPRS